MAVTPDTGFNDKMLSVLRELRPDLIKQLVISHDLLAHLISKNVFSTDEYILAEHTRSDRVRNDGRPVSLFGNILSQSSSDRSENQITQHLEQQPLGAIPASSMSEQTDFSQSDLDIQRGSGNGIRLLKYYQKRQENPDDVYKMESSPRGKVLIINNKSFDDPRTLYREGTDEDCARLLDLFVNRLHFDACPVAENCTAEEMLVQLSNFARDPQLSQVDACAVIILSHGGEGDTIHGTDGRSIRRIDVAGLQDTSSGHRQVACDPVLEQTPLSGPTYADQYFLCPTVEGFVAYRGPFVQLLCEVFQELADTEHVKDMATQLHRRMRAFRQQARGEVVYSISQDISTLDRHWYLNPPTSTPDT
ncbi:hypothetical protein BaRGS_00022702 [Batillaria attramentaria]|uniref:Uncharacterized protein n=1 Tax=Batillaria attramentaria TaxID=370345 RepID=A0ABD0KGC1_9CAEN